MFTISKIGVNSGYLYIKLGYFEFNCIVSFNASQCQCEMVQLKSFVQLKLVSNVKCWPMVIEACLNQVSNPKKNKSHWESSLKPLYTLIYTFVISLTMFRDRLDTVTLIYLWTSAVRTQLNSYTHTWKTFFFVVKDSKNNIDDPSVRDRFELVS